MDIPREVLVALIGAVPAMLAPLISSFMQRRGFAQKAREVEVAEKRVQIIERLLSLEEHLSEKSKKLLQTELADIAKDFVEERIRERSAVETVVESLPIRRRWLLAYEQPTLRASVYRGFFWFFLAIGCLGGISGIIVNLQYGDKDWPFVMIGGLFYIAIGLAFRTAALRQQKRAQGSASEVSTSDLRS